MNDTESIHTITNSANEVIEILSQAEKGDLVLFDVDEVLLTAKDMVLRISAPDQLDDLFYETFMGGDSGIFTPEKIRLLYEWLQQVEVQPVNIKINEMVGKLQQKHITVLGLTRMVPGPDQYPGVCVEDFRHGELKRNGVDFTPTFNNTIYDLLPHIDKWGVPSLARFYKGIIFTGPYMKDIVLKTYLEKQSVLPNRIYFVDNSGHHITSVQKILKTIGIQYVGIQYLDEIFDKDQLNVKLGKFQWKHFIENQVWLNDTQAKELFF